MTTTKDATFFVSPSSGSDSNPGTSAAAPFRSLIAPKLLPYYNARIAHKINIAVLDSEADPTKVPTTIDPVYVDGGSPAIYGVGAPTVYSGPHTVTAIADVSPGAQRVTVAGAAWAADEFCGYHLRVVTGAHVGLTFPVYGNSTDTISIQQGDPDKVHSGDTVELIAPSVKLDISSLNIRIDSRTCGGGVLGGYSRFVLANLWLDSSASANTIQFELWCDSASGIYPVLDFVRLDVANYGCGFKNVILGGGDAIDKSYVTDCNADITNMGVAFYDANMSIISSGGRDDMPVFTEGYTLVYGTAVCGGVYAGDGGELAFTGGCGHLWFASARNWAQCWIAGKDATTPAVLVSIGIADLKIHVEGACNYAVDIAACATVYFHSANSCDPTLTAKSAIRVGAMGQVQIHDNCANFLGATAGQEAYIFSSNSTKSATWPGATTLVSDTLGANLTRTT